MNDGNYIKINRSILEWEWYKNINTKILFLHMLLKANWKDYKFEGKEINRGSFVSSISNLAFETSLTEREIRTAISHLKTTGEVTSKGHNKYTVFTVVKYNLYQSIDKQIDKQETNERQTNDKLTTIIEEGKNSKKGSKEEDKNKEKKKVSKDTKEKAPCYFPNDSRLEQAFVDYVEMRQGIKKPLTTDRAITLAINKLNNLARNHETGTMDSDIAIQILEQSTMSSWQGLFPLKNEKQYNNQGVDWSKA